MIAEFRVYDSLQKWNIEPILKKEVRYGDEIKVIKLAEKIAEEYKNEVRWNIDKLSSGYVGTVYRFKKEIN